MFPAASNRPNSKYTIFLRGDNEEEKVARLKQGEAVEFTLFAKHDCSPSFQTYDVKLVSDGGRAKFYGMANPSAPQPRRAVIKELERRFFTINVNKYRGFLSLFTS